MPQYQRRTQTAETTNGTISTLLVASLVCIWFHDKKMCFSKWKQIFQKKKKRKTRLKMIWEPAYSLGMRNLCHFNFLHFCNCSPFEWERQQPCHSIEMEYMWSDSMLEAIEWLEEIVFAISLLSPFKGNSIQLRCFIFKMILIRTKRMKKKVIVIMSYHHIPFSASLSIYSVRCVAKPTDGNFHWFANRCAFHKMLNICTQFPLHSFAVSLFFRICFSTHP